MGNIRKAAVAGTFYLSSKTDLITNINDLLDKAPTFLEVGKAIIAPHAATFIPAQSPHPLIVR